MSATEETNVRLHASVDGFLLPDFFSAISSLGGSISDVLFGGHRLGICQ